MSDAPHCTKEQSIGTGQIAFKDEWRFRGGRPMQRRSAKLQSVARIKKDIPMTSPIRDNEQEQE